MDSLFFIFSKIIWFILSPDSFLLILILVSLFLILKEKYRAAKISLSIVSIAIVLISFFPIGEWLLFPLENRFQTNPTLPVNIDGIIVLSGAEDTKRSDLWQQPELGAAAERNLAFMQLIKQHPSAKHVFTGGTGSLLDQNSKGADVAKMLYEQQGLDSANIIFERESRNTYENVSYSKKLIQPNKSENWILITTSWHMPRSVGIFCQQQWPVIPYPVDHQTMKGELLRIDFNLASNLSLLKTGIKEWIGLFAYYLSGKTTALLPHQCH